MAETPLQRQPHTVQGHALWRLGGFRADSGVPDAGFKLWAVQGHAQWKYRVGERVVRGWKADPKRLGSRVQVQMSPPAFGRVLVTWHLWMEIAHAWHSGSWKRVALIGLMRPVTGSGAPGRALPLTLNGHGPMTR